MQEIRRALARLRARVGHRGAALMFFALVDLTYAVGLLRADATTKATPLYAFLVSMLPLWAWALIWAGVGLLCLAGAFVRHDRWAFAAASILKVGFGLVSLAGWLWADVTRGYIGAAIWLVFAGFVQVIATWPEPEDVR